MGTFNAHHYRYGPNSSTFLVECDPKTWERYGFAGKTIEESKAVCEKVFARALDGHPLISNKSVWRNFPWLWNDRWHFRNMVLVGDALHTAHFSIGSGTRLAMEDVISLVKALEAEDEIAQGPCSLRSRATSHRKNVCGSGEDQRTVVRAFSRAYEPRAS
jgi:hypothetical protein